jgi:hypothetical protein
MSEKAQLEFLCTEKIPRLLRGDPPADVFREVRKCTESCPDYAFLGHVSPFCEKDRKLVGSEEYCRFGYPPIAQSSPKCTPSYDRLREIEREEAEEARL